LAPCGGRMTEKPGLPSHYTFEEANELILRRGRAIRLSYTVTPVEEKGAEWPAESSETTN